MYFRKILREMLQGPQCSNKIAEYAEVRVRGDRVCDNVTENHREGCERRMQQYPLSCELESCSIVEGLTDGNARTRYNPRNPSGCPSPSQTISAPALQNREQGICYGVLSDPRVVQVLCE